MTTASPTRRVIVPPNPSRPAWIVPRDELVDFTHVGKVPFYPRVKCLLQSHFHQISFLPRQVAAINCAIRGYDLILSLPTSAGKSLCYQLPAIFNETSITLVVSPTKTLIENQIQSLHSLGEKWHTWAQRSHSDRRQHPSLLLSPTTAPRIFYICPEWLLSTTNTSTLHILCRTSRIARIVIDEAHNALSGLSDQHRVAYKLIFSLRHTYPSIPFTLVSASLTTRHQFTLTSALDAHGQFYAVGGPGHGAHRPNFHYRVVHLPSTVGQRIKRGRGTLKLAMVLKYMEVNPGKRGFVFVQTRKLARQVGEGLQRCMPVEGEAEWYHAGEQDRLAGVMARFNAGEIRVLVCTSAFGEGIDNKLVDFVFHYSLPQDMTRYFQETGRVGRAGQDADCILFYSFSDIRPLINVVAHDVPSSSPPQRTLHASQQTELQRVLEYCTDTFTCRHKVMSSLFLPLAPSAYATTPAERLAALYTRASYHVLGIAEEQGEEPVPPDADCGRCDVCNHRYPEPLPGADAAAVVTEFEEMSHFEEITAAEMDAVENAFRNDTTLLVSDLVARLSAPGPAKMKGARASEVVELLAVVKVLRLVYVYVGSGKGVGFRIMVEKGGNRIDAIYRPLPIPYGQLEPLTLPALDPARRAARANRRRRARATTEDTFIDNTGTVLSEAESDEEWALANEASTGDHEEEDESGEDEDKEMGSAASRSETDEGEEMDGSASDAEVMELVLPGEEEDDTEDIEDGSGTRLRSLRSHKRRRSARSSSYELPDPLPPTFTEENTLGSNYMPKEIESEAEGEVEEVAAPPPPKRRRVESWRDSSRERTPTDGERLLARFEEAVKKKKDKYLMELVNRVSSKRMLKRLFERHQSIVDKGGFMIALGKVGASQEDTEILVDFYEWMAYHVLATEWS